MKCNIYRLGKHKAEWSKSKPNTTWFHSCVEEREKLINKQENKQKKHRQLEQNSSYLRGRGEESK